MKIGILLFCNDDSIQSKLSKIAINIATEKLCPNKSFILKKENFNNNSFLSSPFIVISGSNIDSKNLQNNKFIKNASALIIIDDYLKKLNEPTPKDSNEKSKNFQALATRIAGEIATIINKTIKTKIKETKNLNNSPLIIIPNLSNNNPLTKTTIKVCEKEIPCLDKIKMFNFMKRYKGLPIKTQKNKLLKLYKIYNRTPKDIPSEFLEEALFNEYQNFLKNQNQ